MNKYILCILACFLGMGHAWSSSKAAVSEAASISEMLNEGELSNALSVDDVALSLSGEATINICCSFDKQYLLENAFLGYQLDVVLSDGLELVEDNNGKVLCENGFSGTDHSIRCLKKDNHTYRFVVVSMSEEQLPRNGLLLKMYVKVENGASPQGQLNAKVTAAKFTTADLNEETLADVDFHISIVDDKASQSLNLSSLPAMAYGDASYALPLVTVEGLPLTWTSSNTAVATLNNSTLTIKGAGGTTITATQAGNENYDSFSREYQLTVSKAPLTITADNSTKQQGEANPLLTVSYEGFKYNDNASSLTVQPTVTTTATKESPAGTYPITVSGAASNNYEFTYVNGTLTVTEEQTTIETSDISQMANAIYIEPFTAFVGSEASIEVKVKNVNAITSYGFELVLPDGMSIATESDNSFDDAVTLSSRHKGHVATTNKLSDNTYKIGVASLSSKTLTDNDGIVLTIRAQVAGSMATGTYPIKIQNPLLVESDGSKPAMQETVTSVTIEDYIKGDVDGDGVVDLADAVLVINHYVGKPVNNFIEKAADVDGDGVVDLADAVKIINYYVGKVPSLSRRPLADEHEPQ